EHTDMGWEVYPDGLHDVLVRVTRDYEPAAIYITENGAAFPDVRVHDGGVHDMERTAFLESYIGAVGRAIAADAPVRGYFVWSLLDIWKGPCGYWTRCGIVFVAFPPLERVRRDSFYWSRALMASRRGAPRPPSPIVAA